MHYDAATRYVKTIRAGDAEYYKPRQRGTVTVTYDNRIWVYKLPARPDRRAARRALEMAFMGDGKFSGRWPEYRVD
jgi:hypothetical protein